MSKITQNPIVVSTIYILLLLFVFLLISKGHTSIFETFLLILNNDYIFTKYILCILPSFLLISKNIEFKLSSSIFFCLYFFIYIPIILFFFNDSSELFQKFGGIKYTIPSKNFEFRDILLIQIILCLIFCSFFYYLKQKRDKKKIYFFKIKSENFYRVLKLIFFILLITILYELKTIFFIEEIRFQQISLDLRGYLYGRLGYIVYWVSDFILPTLIFYNLLIKKKHNYFIFGIFFYIFIFYVFGAKIFLAILSFIIFFYYLFVFNLKLKLFFFKNCFLLYGFFACFVLILILLLIPFEDYGIFDSAKYLFTRIYFIQARNFYLYYDVFNFSDFYFFTNIQFLKEFGFHEISPSKLVSSFWGKGNLTSHYLSIEGIATLGVFGIILSSFILLFILRFIDDFEHLNDKENILFIYYFIITTYFINVNLSVIILTHGLFILIFLCFLKLEN